MVEEVDALLCRGIQYFPLPLTNAPPEVKVSEHIADEKVALFCGDVQGSLPFFPQNPHCTQYVKLLEHNADEEVYPLCGYVEASSPASHQASAYVKLLYHAAEALGV